MIRNSIQFLAAFMLFLPSILSADAPVCKSRSADSSYHEMDIESLRQLSANEEDAERRYILYRLFPLSKTQADLENLESKLEEGSAEDFAILSALWAFRSQGANPLKWIRYIRRSDGFLKRALEMDPNDPMVSLIDSQALFYKPKFAGGGKEKALKRLLDLRERIQDSSSCADLLTEVEIWIWTVNKELNPDKARSLKNELLGRPISKVHRRYLEST